MRAVFLLFLGLWSCTEPVREARDGAVVVPDCQADPDEAACDPASADNAMFTWAGSTCDFLLDCCPDGDRARTLSLVVGAAQLPWLFSREPALLEDHRACRRALALALFSRHQASYLSRDEGRQAFDRASARECLARFALGAQRCAPGLVLANEDHLAPACQHLFTPLVHAEGACTVDDDCVEAPDGGRSVCQSRSERRDDGGVFFALTGVCRPLPELGEACPLPDGACGEEAFCAADQTCRLRAPAGEPCLAAPCDPRSWCDTAPAVPICTPRRPDFGPCLHDSHCQPGAACHASLLICLEVVDPDPLDVEFDFCLGEGGTPVARALVGDGGTP